MKMRSLIDYARINAGDAGGYNLGIDGQTFIRREGTPRTFQVPRIGTQGKSVGDIGAITDISALTTPKIQINLRSGGAVTATLTTAGNNTGIEVAAALEAAINAALLAAGSDERVWCLFDGGDDHYEVYDQRTGLASTVVITDGLTDNCADDLKLGVPNGGTETAGTDDQDCLLYTSGGPKYGQPIESNPHRNARFHGGIVRKKKTAEFDIETLVNMSGNAGDSLDNAVLELWESLLGRKTVNSGVFIEFTQDIPVIYFSMVRVSTTFAEFYTGGYVKTGTMTFSGTGPATLKYAGKLCKATRAGITKVVTPVTASADVVMEARQSRKYSVGAYVMVMDTDGRTILAGGDGTLKINAVVKSTETVTLNSTVTIPANGFVVPWNPGAVQTTVRDAIYTDLEGTIKLQATGGSALNSVTNMVLEMDNQHTDLDNRYGKDANNGFIPGNRLNAKLSVTFDLAGENLGDVVTAEDFAGYDPEIVLGNASSGRYFKFTASRWLPEVPQIDVPQNGPTPVTLTGMLYESAPGARDPFKARFY